MPRLPKNTPSVFDAEESVQQESSASARADENHVEPTSAADLLTAAPAEDKPSSPPAADAPPVGARKRKKKPEDMRTAERQDFAQREASKHLDEAIKLYGKVIKGDFSKATVGDRLRAADAIRETSILKTPVGTTQDKGRPKILIGFGPRPGGDPVVRRPQPE